MHILLLAVAAWLWLPPFTAACAVLICLSYIGATISQWVLSHWSIADWGLKSSFTRETQSFRKLHLDDVPKKPRALMMHILTEEVRTLSMANSYAQMVSQHRLPGTHADVKRMDQTLFKNSADRNRGFDLDAAQLLEHIQKFVSSAHRCRQPACVYLSMHGAGGSAQKEALVGNKGDLVCESKLQAMIAGAPDIPILCFIIDTCNSGGFFNFPHIFSFQPNGRVYNETHDDTPAGGTNTFDKGMPCITISAVREGNFAEASNDDGSLFTRTLINTVEMHKRAYPLSKLLASVNVKCTQAGWQKGTALAPVCSFNSSFLRLVQTHVGMKIHPRDALAYVAL